MRKILGSMALALLLVACKNEKDAEPTVVLLPLEITRTASYTPEVLTSKFSYNSENRISREDIFDRNTLQSFTLYTYNAAGNLVKKSYYDANSSQTGQDEITYNAAGKPERLSHAYVDLAGTATPHHFRTYEFNAEGQVTRLADFSPNGNPQNSQTFEVLNSLQVKSVFYDGNGKLASKIALEYDGKNTPFSATGTELFSFPGNLLNQVTQDSLGKILISSQNQIVYNARNFPVKITQTYSDGTKKTEEYLYKQP